MHSAEGAKVTEIVRELEVTEQSYTCSVAVEYTDLNVTQAKRLKELE